MFLKNSKWISTKGAGYSLQINHSGDYYLWFHRYVPVTWGWNPLLGKGNSNSLWIGVDNQSFDSAGDDTNKEYGIWIWIKEKQKVSLSAGAHILNIKIREGGYALDSLFFTQDPNYIPYK
jgi:hypothetical protein